MKFKLGQKVKYKRVTKKIEIGEQYLTLENFGEDEERILERRESIKLENERTGYIMGRRRFVFKTILSIIDENYDYNDMGNVAEFVDIKRQEYGYAYQVAYGMGCTNYVLEEDLIKLPEAYSEIEKIIAAVSIYLARIQLDKETLKVNPLRAEYLKGYRQCRDDVGILARELIEGK